MSEKITVRFEKDVDLDHIEVVIRAPGDSEEVQRLRELVSGCTKDKLTVFDSGGGHCLIDANDIIIASSSGKQVHIVTSDGFFYAKQRLHSIEQLLSDSRFLRISRFEIINLRKVRKYDFTLDGSFRIEFENGMETWASRRYISAVKKRLSGEEEKP